jgi:hypothetical protein
MGTVWPLRQFSSCIPYPPPTKSEDRAAESKNGYEPFVGVGPFKISCHRERPGPGRRKPRRSQCSAVQTSKPWPAIIRTCSNINATFVVVLFVFVLLFDGAAAQERFHPDLQGSELLFDRSPRPEVVARHVLMAREPKTISSSSTSVVPSATPVLVSTTADGSGTLALATAAPSATTLPQPFDTTIGSNFTSGSGCPAFFNNFLGNSLFQSCYPFSLLLQVSVFPPHQSDCQLTMTYCRHHTISLKLRRAMSEQQSHWMRVATPTSPSAMPT